MDVKVVDTVKGVFVLNENEYSHYKDRYKVLAVTDAKAINTGNNILEGDLIKAVSTSIGDDLSNLGLEELIGVVEFSEGAFWIVNRKKSVSIPLWSETTEVYYLNNIYKDPTSCSAMLQK